MFDYLHPKDGAVVDGLENQEIVYAKDQPEYIPLRTLRGKFPMYPVLSRWTLTPEQRQAVANGADIFLELSVCSNPETGAPNPLQPIRMAVSDASGSAFAEWFSVCLLERPITPVEMHNEKFAKDAGIKL